MNARRNANTRRFAAAVLLACITAVACDAAEPREVADDSTTHARESLALELADGGRIEAWTSDDGVDAERLDGAGRVVRSAHWDRTRAAATLVEGEAGVPAEVPGPEGFADDLEGLAHWLADYEPPEHGGSDQLAAEPDIQASAYTGTFGYSSPREDLLTIACPAGTTRVWGRIMDLNTIRNLTTQVFLGVATQTGAFTELAYDYEATSTASPWAYKTGGPGTYRVRVRKLGSTGTEDYSVEIHCRNAANQVISHPPLVLVSNQ